MLQNFKNKITNIKENKAFNNININLLNGNLKKKAWNEYKYIIYYLSSNKDCINSLFL